jgi:hypothetical protein
VDQRLWVYDYRTNIHHTLKTNPLQRVNLDEFVERFHPENRFQRKPSWDADKNPEDRWRSFEYDELLKRDKVSLDVFWLKDEAQEDSASLPEPDVIAAENRRGFTCSARTVRGNRSRPRAGELNQATSRIALRSAPRLGAARGHITDANTLVRVLTTPFSQSRPGAVRLDGADAFGALMAANPGVIISVVPLELSRLDPHQAPASPHWHGQPRADVLTPRCRGRAPKCFVNGGAICVQVPKRS